MATTYIKSYHASDGKSVLVAIKKSLDYGKNPNKTRNGELISYYECDPRTADLEFLIAKKQYASITGRVQNHKKDILLYQIRQSFTPNTITPEKANESAYELVMRLTKGKHAFIVATHEDKNHIHSHIYFNSTSLDCKKKFKNIWGLSKVVRRISDYICVENGLSIVENPKSDHKSYDKWLGNNKRISHRDTLRLMIDEVIEKTPIDFDDFLKQMTTKGYVVKKKKYISFQSGEDRPIRCNSLGENYNEEAIQKRINDKKELISNIDIESEQSDILPTPTISLIIKIEDSIKAKNSPGYERWAKLFNLKQAAQTLVYLQENHIEEYKELETRTKEITQQFYDLSGKIKVIESKISEISELQKQISNYSKTKDIYIAYRKSGYNKKYLAEHEQEISLHQISKKAFDKLDSKKIPSIKNLQKDYTLLKSEKANLYKEYKLAKENMKTLTLVKSNTDRLLQYSEIKVPSIPFKSERT